MILANGGPLPAGKRNALPAHGNHSLNCHACQRGQLIFPQIRHHFLCSPGKSQLKPPSSHDARHGVQGCGWPPDSPPLPRLPKAARKGGRSSTSSPVTGPFAGLAMTCTACPLRSSHTRTDPSSEPAAQRSRSAFALMVVCRILLVVTCRKFVKLRLILQGLARSTHCSVHHGAHISRGQGPRTTKEIKQHLNPPTCNATYIPVEAHAATALRLTARS